MNFKKITALLCAASLISCVFAGCSGSSTASSAAGSATTASVAAADSKPLSGKHYKLAVNATFAPFEVSTVDTSGNTVIQGFDVDLVEAMSKDLGFTYEFNDMEFKGLIGALQSGRADFVISGLSPTEERKKTVDFTDNYFTVKTALIEKKGGTLKTMVDIKGKKVSAVFGTDYEREAKAAGAVVTALDSSPLVMQELLNGRVDASLMDASQAALKAKENPSLEYHVIPAAEINNGVADVFAIACPKGSPLVATLNAELKKLNENGTVKTITEKWMGKEFLSDK